MQSNVTPQNLSQEVVQLLQPSKHYRLTGLEKMAGFTAADASGGEMLPILVKAFVHSDEKEFYKYADEISKIFLGDHCLIDTIFAFLVVIHQDQTADVYVNNAVPVMVQILAKNGIKAGEPVRVSQIADITRLEFAGISINPDENVIFCFKKGWKFGLYFNLEQWDKNKRLDTDGLYKELGRHYKYLSFQEVYLIVQNQPTFQDMVKDGWFPFVRLIGGEFERLAEYYKDKRRFESSIKAFVNSFNAGKVDSFVMTWWSSKLFSDKKAIIEAGIRAFFTNTEDGYINCIKNLYSEIEGLVRISFEAEKGKKPSFKELMQYVEEKANARFEPVQSLAFPQEFFQYLQEGFFKGFDVLKGEVDLSRHSTSHGVARAEEYTKAKALQAILILDQIYFYFGNKS